MTSQELQTLIELIASKVPEKNWSVRFFSAGNGKKEIRVAKHEDVTGLSQELQENPPVKHWWFVKDAATWEYLYPEIARFFDDGYESIYASVNRQIDEYVKQVLDPIAYDRKALREECNRQGITEVFGKPIRGTTGYLMLWSALVHHKTAMVKKEHDEHS